MKSKTIVLALCALCASIAFTIPTAVAQVPVPYGPKDQISFTVTFDGPGTDEIARIAVGMALISPLHEGQEGFSTEFDAQTVKQLAPGKFNVSTAIPDYLASGTYSLRVVSAGPQSLGAIYSYRANLPSITITVKNDKQFTQPNLKGVELNPKP